mmetsp:Transcript_207/g.876  ORF Transcript_207/g.876 Transcript_207/m.876 type:complete len:264 (+) Transcript_207:467-1258(+)
MSSAPLIARVRRHPRRIPRRRETPRAERSRDRRTSPPHHRFLPPHTRCENLQYFLVKIQRRQRASARVWRPALAPISPSRPRDPEARIAASAPSTNPATPSPPPSPLPPLPPPLSHSYSPHSTHHRPGRHPARSPIDVSSPGSRRFRTEPKPDGRPNFDHPPIALAPTPHAGASAGVKITPSMDFRHSSRAGRARRWRRRRSKRAPLGRTAPRRSDPEVCTTLAPCARASSTRFLRVMTAGVTRRPRSGSFFSPHVSPYATRA